MVVQTYISNMPRRSCFCRIESGKNTESSSNHSSIHNPMDLPLVYYNVIVV